MAVARLAEAIRALSGSTAELDAVQDEAWRAGWEAGREASGAACGWGTWAGFRIRALVPPARQEVGRG